MTMLLFFSPTECRPYVASTLRFEANKKMHLYGAEIEGPEFRNSSRTGGSLSQDWSGLPFLVGENTLDRNAPHSQSLPDRLGRTQTRKEDLSSGSDASYGITHEIWLGGRSGDRVMSVPPLEVTAGMV